MTTQPVVLTADEVAALPEGTRIHVLWGGGNRGWYAIHHEHGCTYAAIPGVPRFDTYNPLLPETLHGGKVGPERWNTRVTVEAPL